MKILFEDDNLLVINKPAGMIVHQGAGEKKSTIVDWLFDRYPSMQKLNWPDPDRPGIIHRLDKDTSGLLLIAKNPQILEDFQNKFQNHEIKKTYLALVLGPVSPESGEIITKISRSGKDFRNKTTSILNMDESAKTAISHYQILNNYSLKSNVLCLMSVSIDTGRTHQIRVQMKYKGWPIIGDEQYNTKISRKISKEMDLKRQFLHAHKLEFCYNGKEMSFKSELPSDLQILISKLKT
ncbi:MAG: Pseudouridine synthase [uncultured bacterium]|nr:MAG: Pseudouridine synthase [uncultured bacterium]